jgi:TPR repeat protein
MKVTFVDQKLRKHCIELESSTAISSITAMLGNIWPVPSGFSPKLVYENRTLLKHESLDSIGYFASKFISYFGVKESAKSAQGSNSDIDLKICPRSSFDMSMMTAAGPLLGTDSSVKEFARVRIDGLNDWHWDWRIDGVHASPAMNGRTGVICGAFIANTGRWPVQIDGNGSSSQLQVALRPCYLKAIHEMEIAEQKNAPIPLFPAVHSSPMPSADELREGSRVRVDGLVSKPAMNGCTGVICGAFIADNGRWPVQIDGNGSCSQHQVALRPCNIQLLPVHISADKSTPAKTNTKRVAAVVQAGGGVRLQHLPTLHPVIVRLAAHPASSLAGREFVAQLPAHFLYRLATRVSMQRWQAVFRCRPSQAHAKQWHVIDIDIARQQRRALLCKAALFAVLVPRLLRVQGEHGVRYPLNLAQRIASRRHFLGSNKDEAEGVFEEGQRLYREQRFSEAAERWGRAALLQHGPSHAHLSDMLIDGRPGVAKDVKRAFELAAAGAALGCGHSKGALGHCYVFRFGVSKDAARGLALGRESEAAGSCFGQLVVGVCYYLGCGGVAQDYAEAVRLFRLAAAQGHADAQYSLGLMFDHGKGVAQDFAEAVRLYSLAAAQGDAHAQVNLGVLFCNGQGVVQDRAEAIRLFRLAAAQGDANATAFLRRLGA